MNSEEETKCSECGEGIAKGSLSVTKVRKIYCRECWVHFIQSRFRKRLFELGKPTRGSAGEVFRPAEPTLIVYDGSPSSVALINLVRDSIIAGKYPDNDSQNPRNIPFPFRFAILVIFESDWIMGKGMVDKQKKHLKELYKWVKETEAKIGSAFPLIATSIEMAVTHSVTWDRSYMKCQRIGDDNWKFNKKLLEYPLPVEGEYPGPNVIGVLCRSTIDDLRIPFDPESHCRTFKIMTALDKSKTSQKDYLSIMKSNLIISAAQQLQVYKVLLPEDQTSLAIKMFTLMSLGRGAQLADQMSFVSDVHGVTLGRPLMDFSSDDLRQYVECIPLESTEGLVNRSSSKKRKSKIDTVDRQCDEFIVELQKGYAATVSTLTRIGGKLQPSSVVEIKASVETGAGEKSSECKFCKRPMEDTDATDLCYGCSRILKDMDDPYYLWDLINFKQFNWLYVVESSEEQRLEGARRTEWRKHMNEVIHVTSHYRDGLMIGETTYKGWKKIDEWGEIPPKLKL